MMQPLSQKDLWPNPIYEKVRDDFRKTVIAAKQHRRVSVGPFITLIFENRLTVKFQVQEILRIERISAPEAVQEELDGFNEMLPSPSELSATLMVELTGTEPEVAAELKKLTGLHDHVWLELDGRRVQARFDEGRDDGKRISAVQYVRFPVGHFDSAKRAALMIDHPNYSHRLELPAETRKSLAADLAET